MWTVKVVYGDGNSVRVARQMEYAGRGEAARTLAGFSKCHVHRDQANRVYVVNLKEKPR